jgi:hypothetical protein
VISLPHRGVESESKCDATAGENASVFVKHLTPMLGVPQLIQTGSLKQLPWIVTQGRFFGLFFTLG